MSIRTFIGIALAGFVLAGCDQSGPLAPAEEEGLALSLAAEADHTFDREEVGLAHLVQRLVRAVEEHGDATAVALLEDARALRVEARTARDEGDLDRARALARESYDKLLQAIVHTFPDAPARVGQVVDRVRARIEQRLGDRDAPRIRGVLAHVAELRELADAALDEGRSAEALALNLRAVRVLVRLVYHLRHGLDEGEPATDVMNIGLGG